MALFIGCFLKEKLVEKLDFYIEKFMPVKNFQEKHSFLFKARTLFFLWMATTSFMWSYVVYCYLVFPINSPVVCAGVLFSLIHTLAPLAFYYWQNIIAMSLTMSLTGIGFQVAFCLYSGGIYSPAAIWLSLHPVILGFFGSIAWIYFSVIFNAFIVLALYLLGAYQLLPVDTLASNYRILMIISCYVGLDFLIAIFTIGIIRFNKDKNEELQKSRELSENLIRVICHDVNNPLTLIHAYSLQLQNENDPEKREKYLSRIFQAGVDIKNITSSVRQWIAYRDGKHNLQHSIIYVSELTDFLRSHFFEQCELKKIKLQIIGNEKLIKFYGDKNAVFYQVYSNLISNAIKFSFENSTIDIKFWVSDHQFFSEVRDHGVGIDPKILDTITSAYTKTTSRGTKNEVGTGFGLPIVAALVDKMQGTLKIRNANELNESEKGSIFTITFPRA
jgi:signal transduction histidine kinase